MKYEEICGVDKGYIEMFCAVFVTIVDNWWFTVPIIAVFAYIVARRNR